MDGDDSFDLGRLCRLRDSTGGIIEKWGNKKVIFHTGLYGAEARRKLCAQSCKANDIGWINTILLFNISNKRDGVDGYGQIQPYYIFLTAIWWGGGGGGNKNAQINSVKRYFDEENWRKDHEPNNLELQTKKKQKKK